MHKRSLLRSVLAVGLAAAAFASAGRPASAITVDEIVKRGTVRIGVLTGAPPFGTVDERGNPAGYDVDVANLVAGYMGVKAELTPLTPPARIPALESGKVDFLIATLAPTPARAKTVMFSIPYSAFQMAIVSRSQDNFTKLDDLQKKRVGVNRGGSQDAALQKVKVPGMQIVRYEDDSTVAQALIAGQIDAAALPDTIAKAIMAQRKDANMKIGFIFFKQPNSMAVKLGDHDLKQWLNTTINFMKGSGELDEVFQKWTETPLPTLESF